LRLPTRWTGINWELRFPTGRRRASLEALYGVLGAAQQVVLFENTRRITLRLPSACPYQAAFTSALSALRSP